MAADSEDSPCVRALLITVAVLALYVLSIGPVSRFTAFPFDVPHWFDVTYRPVLWTAEHCKPVDVALWRYTGLWIEHPQAHTSHP